MASLLWTTGTNVAAAGNETSGWFYLSGADELRVTRESTGGTYELELEYSRDGVTVDATDTLEFPANDDIVTEPVAGNYARFRVKNTGITAFTAHRTSVYLS